MELNYRKIGEQGAPLFVLHGLYGCSDNWMSIGRHLAERYQVYLIDLRNHGRSFHDAEHSYDAMVADLAWLIQDLELDKVTIVGHSMGGKVAMKLAADYPEKVEQLVVLDIAPKNYMEDSVQTGQYGFHRHLIRTMLNTDIAEAANLREVDELLQTKIPEQRLRQFLMKNVGRNTGRKYQWRFNLKALDEWLDEIVGGVDFRELEDRMPILNYPVLFVRGGSSAYIEKDDEDRIRMIYPEAEIQTIEGAGHWLHAEQPAALVDQLKLFLKNL
ncbi:alpha/beta fold hydrolase [Prolixibacteraceae bacterium JC049]|nr:alpha/beta fold hydrolase [Prolixibacteraceae bacterium JC049]